jgi:hypothetical protein
MDAAVAAAAAADAVALRIALRAAAAAPRSLDLRSAERRLLLCFGVLKEQGEQRRIKLVRGILHSAVINSALALRSPACTDLLLQCNALISEIHFRRHSSDKNSSSELNTATAQSMRTCSP